MPQQTKISLVIPVLNEETSINALAESIRNQTKPPDETIFVDGGSTDETIKIINRLVSQNAFFKLIKTERATPGRGRNIGAADARFEWIAFTDAGIRLEPSWLEELAKVVQQDETIDVVYGSFEPEQKSFFERYAALSYIAAKQRKNGAWWRGPSIASALMRRKVWKKIGGFPDLRAAEDLIFMEEIERQKFKIGYAPRAIVWWQLRPTLGSTFQKFVIYSKHNVWAGRQYDWHYGIAKQYLLLAPFVALGLFHHPLWLSVTLLWLLLRTAKRIWTRREDRSLWWALNPLQFMAVAFLILVIDLATYLGWIQAWLGKPSLVAKA